MTFQKLWWLPFALILIVFSMRLTSFNIYKHMPEGATFETPVGLRLNIDGKGVGTCAADFPRRFIEQSRCGYYYLARPGYSALLFALSKPIVWAGELIPDSLWQKIPLERSLFPYAAAVLVAVFANILFAWLALWGIRRLFAPYISNPAILWLAQMLYASAYGTSAHLADALAEVFQHLLLIWIPILFRDYRGFFRGASLGLLMTGKEVVCAFAGGLISSWKERKLSRDLLLLPIPILLWFAFLKLGHGVAIKSYPVSDWGYGTWYLTIFSDWAIFQEKARHVFGYFFYFLFPTFIPLLWIGIPAYFFLLKRIPFLIHIQMIMALGQVIAMGYMHPRVLYNFLFMPLVFSTALAFEFGIERSPWKKSAKIIPLLGFLSAIFGLICVAFVFGIY
jgi:hypothetical protein